MAKFIDNRPDDRIGLVAFAKDAYIASPLTLDHDFLQHNLERLDIGKIDENATAIGSALMAALNRLKDLKDKSKIVILMTDGQNNSGKVQPLTAADAAAGAGGQGLYHRHRHPRQGALPVSSISSDRSAINIWMWTWTRRR